MEYDVPRSLDVPDRIGIPFFTTLQFGIFLAGVAIMVVLWKLADPHGIPLATRIWLTYIPLLALILPRSISQSGWTVYQVILARVGRWSRPRRAIWRPE